MVDGISSSLNGMDNAVSRLNRAASNIARASIEPAPGEAPVDLGKELVESKLSAVMFEANAKILKSQLDMEKRILDILA